MLRCRTLNRLVLFFLIFLMMATAIPPITVSSEDWWTGKIVGLCLGTRIYRGPAEGYGYHTTVPENDWSVKIINGPRNGDWWDTSRKEAGDPGGGTGWVKKSQAESCKQSSSPPQQSPASAQLTEGILLSSNQVYPGDRIEGRFLVRNNGGQDWRPQSLGIAVSGPSYLDFGWRRGISLRPGESYSFEGAIPNAPDAPGTYSVNVSWQDPSGNWQSLGGNASFVVQRRYAAPTPTPTPLPVANVPELNVTFFAVPESINRGECALLRWTAGNAKDWYLDGVRLSQRSGFTEVCPTADRTYTLRAVRVDNQTREYAVTVRVNSSEPQREATISFWADSTLLASGQCTSLRWETNNIRSAYLDGAGISGNASQKVCPSNTTTYTLRVVKTSGEETRQVTIQVASQPNGSSSPQSSGPTGCHFALGFEILRKFIPEIVGDCVDNESHNPFNGDGLQNTTGYGSKGGLMVWRKSDNWTAYTDGHRTWINGPLGLQNRLNSQRFVWELLREPPESAASARLRPEARSQSAGLGREELSQVISEDTFNRLMVLLNTVANGAVCAAGAAALYSTGVAPPETAWACAEAWLGIQELIKTNRSR